MKHLRWISVFLLVLAIWGCKNVNVDFSYEPTSPKTGDTVRFTNLSTGGEDYFWTFGDNSVSEDKNPIHLFKQVGTYIVTLQEKKTKKSISHTVTVSDSVPSFSADTDSVYLFIPVQLTASVWNPYGHAVTYQWVLSEQTYLVKGELTDSEITVYFTQTGEQTVNLTIVKDGVTTHTRQTFNVQNTPAPLLLYELKNGKQYCQRIYQGTIWESPRQLNYPEGIQLLGHATTVQEAKDSLEQKIYYASQEGLQVKNANGSNPVLLAADSVITIAISLSMNRLFYSTSSGVYMLPLIHTDNNRTTSVFRQLSTLPAQKLATDEAER